MKTTRVVVPWEQGLHLRPAAQIVRVASKFSSQIHLQIESIVADARSALSILMLGATVGTSIDIQIHGDDEHDALVALQNFFTDSQSESEGEHSGCDLATVQFAA